MTVMTDAPQNQASAPAPFRRLPELIIAGVGVLAAGVLQGGFALAITRSDDDTLRTSVLPALESAGMSVPADDAVTVLNTLAAWFGYSFVLIAALCGVGWFFATYRPRARSTGWWFAGAGIACLLGTQFVLYPVAFLFFLSAALFAVRTTPQRSTP